MSEPRCHEIPWEAPVTLLAHIQGFVIKSRHFDGHLLPGRILFSLEGREGPVIARGERQQVTVLLDQKAGDRFSAYCEQRGFKKSTLIARLVREHLDREGFASQPSFLEPPRKRGVRQKPLGPGRGT